MITKHLIVYLMILIIVIITYENSITNDFAFDDNLAIVNNNDVTTNTNDYYNIFKHDIWGIITITSTVITMILINIIISS